jgi:hypothetical protein
MGMAKYRLSKFGELATEKTGKIRVIYHVVFLSPENFFTPGNFLAKKFLYKNCRQRRHLQLLLMLLLLCMAGLLHAAINIV